MIGYIKGTLVLCTEDGILLENNGIGYEIRVPLSVMDELPEKGKEVKIFTYLYVKEDILALYGFLSKEDLGIFKLLITVNGIGPKGALGILSAITPDNLRFAVLSEDTATIAKAPGIGKKTAGKLILELKDKFSVSDAFSRAFSGELAEGAGQGEEDTGNDGMDAGKKKRIRTEAIEALMALGYSSTEAHKAVSKVDLPDGMEVEDVLKLSLKNISF